MRASGSLKLCFLCIFVLFFTAQPTESELYPDIPESDNVYVGNYVDDMELNAVPADKRACVRRGGNCDHRPNDCCYNSSCRCNLWGSNCRCQRMGLFQKWG